MSGRTCPPFFEIRTSTIQGLGAFAIRRIRKSTRIIEYQGERISTEEADRRYDDDQSEHPHVLLFTVNKKTIIDAGVGGNEAKYINHSCEPNCEAVIEDGRVYIEALRRISPGEELTYDYQLERDGLDPESERRYACRCGTPTCRGTLLSPLLKSRMKTKRKNRTG
jgi:SET domain-containing protein